MKIFSDILQYLLGFLNKWNQNDEKINKFILKYKGKIYLNSWLVPGSSPPHSLVGGTGGGVVCADPVN